jgi:hypothetical protein
MLFSPLSLTDTWTADRLYKSVLLLVFQVPKAKHSYLRSARDKFFRIQRNELHLGTGMYRIPIAPASDLSLIQLESSVTACTERLMNPHKVTQLIGGLVRIGVRTIWRPSRWCVTFHTSIWRLLADAQPGRICSQLATIAHGSTGAGGSISL